MNTHERTLAINLDSTTFGTFAEIGAGQEVARWFLQAGGASGTVAKTISAYDKTFSDAIYGEAGRYVSRDRLIAMLDHEYALLVERLDATRGDTTRFFVFADTVSARNFAGTNECHGWMGLRFQARPHGAPNDLLLHVNMRDTTNLGQQQALGILGVNLLYAAFKTEGPAQARLVELLADLSLDRLEIDVLEARGPDVNDPGPGVIGLALVRGGLAQVVIPGDGGRLLPPSEVLRKRPILVERTTARRDAPADAIPLALRQFARERGGAAGPGPLLLRELSLLETPDVAADDHHTPTDDEAMRWLAARGAGDETAALSRFQQTFALTAYLRRYSQEPIRFVLSVPTLAAIFLTVHKEGLEGGLLEGLGRLLAADVKVYAAGAGAGSADAIRLPKPLGHLYTYLLEAGWIVPLG